MEIEHKHIILLGFKHTGKSTVGRLLAERLQCPFIDLDQQIEQNYQKASPPLKTREIFKQHGEEFFRDCETQALRQVIHSPCAVIALGGGAPLREENQKLIKSHWLVHLTADPEVVYTRIMAHGKPAYFPEDKDPREFFQGLWNRNQSIYAGLANFSVDNTHSAQQAVTLILKTIGKTDEIHHD